MKNKNIGIYIFIVNNKFAYIGQSVDIENRLKNHIKKIERCNHPNISKDIKYSYSDVKYEVLELCNKESLNEREKYYYDIYSHEYTMLNIQECGNSRKRFDSNILDGDVNLFFYETDSYIQISDECYISKMDDLISISELYYFLTKNADVIKSIPDIVNSEKVLDKIYYSSNLRLKYSFSEFKDKVSNRNAVKFFKDEKMWKTRGARDNRNVYVNKYIWFAICYEIHPAFSYIILDMIVKNISNPKVME